MQEEHHAGLEQASREQANRELLERILEALNSGDEDAFVAMWHEDAELYGFPGVPDAPDVYRGRDGVRTWLANLRRTFDDVRFEPTEITIRGDVGVVVIAATATGTGSGVPIEWSAYIAARVRDGKLVYCRAVADRDEAFEAAGID
jgi:ketosteroid isomerase-like protein